MAKKDRYFPNSKYTDWNKEPNAQDDPLRNPVGLYAGPLKRVAIEDGTFDGVEMPKGSRKKGY